MSRSAGYTQLNGTFSWLAWRLCGCELPVESQQEFRADLYEQVPQLAVHGPIVLGQARIPACAAGHQVGVFCPLEEHALQDVQFRGGEHAVHCPPFTESKDKQCRNMRCSSTPRRRLSPGWNHGSHPESYAI